MPYKNPEDKLARERALRKAQPGYGYHRTVAWRKNHPGYRWEGALASWMKRRAAKLQAVPVWADLEGIRLFYWLAKQMKRTIDHIIPLQHPLVCGLHTMGNLQMLTYTDNVRKHNKFNVN